MISATLLEAIAVAFGIISVFLSVRQHIWSWPTALVNVALYFWLFYRVGLYSDMGLQVVYFALSLYGWYEWLYGGKGHTKLEVSRATPRVWLGVVAAGVVCWLILGSITSRLKGAALPYVDAATTTTSLVAQWMMTRKILENWAIWIAVDVVYVGMFIFKHLYMTAGLYAVFLVLAALGHIEWKRSLASQTAAA